MLNNIKIGVSGFDGSIYIYRHGKHSTVALDKRRAEPDVIAAFIQHMLHRMPKGAEKTISFGDKQYRLICKPVIQGP